MNKGNPWDYAPQLMLNGWSVIPLPKGEKGPPPAGLTGALGADFDESAILDYAPESNVAIRMTETTVGLDFDLYRDADGTSTLNDLQTRLGRLPESVGVTSHDSPLTQGVTLFFSVPKGFKFRGGVANMDIIQHTHRYSVAAPSIHPSGRVYRWVTSAGSELGSAPEVESLPKLPEAWLIFLKKDEEEEPDIELEEEFAKAEADGAPICRVMRKALQTSVNNLRGAGGASRHDRAVKAAWSLNMLRAAGHTGYARARAIYTRSWLEAMEVAGRPGVEFEIKAAFTSAEIKIGSTRRECSCGAGRGSERRGVTSRQLWRN